MVIHQPEQADDRPVLPEEIDWKPFRAFPPAHPEDRVLISAVFYIGLGSTFDEQRQLAYIPGAVVVLPGRTLISTVRNLEPTSPKSRRSDRWESNTSTRARIPGAGEHVTPP